MIDTNMIEKAICQDCFNYDCPQPCQTEDFQLVTCLFLRMQNEIMNKYNFNFAEPKSYKKLDPVLSKQVRAIYKRCTDMLNLDPTKPLYTHHGGIKIAEGFERLVIGDYGPYLEYDLSQVPAGMRYSVEPGQEYRKLPGWRNRVKYIWYTIPDSDPHVKIYWQLRTVSYADYKRKKFYISPFEVIQ